MNSSVIDNPIVGPVSDVCDDGRRRSWQITRLLVGRVLLVGLSLTTVLWACHLRISLAQTLPWQCDEIPMITRFTGLCGHARNEVEARRFHPSLYTFRKGAIRAFRAPPNKHYAVHTTTHFWTNLSIHLFGATPWGGRALQFFWSVVAIVATAWMAWLASGRFLAACVAGAVVALSPSAVAYGAQARGYAESLALAPLLLIAVEYLRRRPESAVRAVLVLLCGLQLALTVYTMWVFWVLPTLIIAVILVPRSSGGATERRHLRSTLMVILVGLVAFMAIYTAERWKALTSSASYGARFGNTQDMARFLWGLAVNIVPAPRWLAVPALVGMFVIRRCRVPYWGAVLLLAAAAQVLFGLANGSSGYERNLQYWLVPIALCTGLGVQALLRARVVIAHPQVALMVIAPFVIGAALQAGSGLERHARRILLPDWGALTRDVQHDAEGGQEGSDRQWILRCQANHWQINWYDTGPSPGILLDSADHGDIEFVLGSELGPDGRPKIYESDPSRSGIRPHDLPAYLARLRPQNTRHGIELRRFRGHLVSDARALSLPPDAPVLIVLVMSRPVDAGRWLRFMVESDAYRRGAFSFKPTWDKGRLIHTMLAPAASVGRILPALRQDFDFADDLQRLFELRR